MKLTTLPLVAALLALLSSCGGSSDPRELTNQGSQALSAGDHAAAAKSFDQALAVLGSDTGNPEWMRAKMGAIQARTVTDPERAKQDFLEVAESQGSRVSADDFSLVASRLGDQKHLPEAISVLAVGMKKFPESKHLQALRDELGKRAEAGEGSGIVDSLKGLGYVGGE